MANSQADNSVPFSSQGDPRLNLYPEDLEAANTQAMPNVGRGSGRGEGLVLLAGVIGVLALGGITWISLGSHKPSPHQPLPTAQIVAPPVQTTTMPAIDPLLNPQPEPGPQSVLFQPSPQPAPATVAISDPNAVRAPAMIIDNSIPVAPAPTSVQAATAANAGKPTLNANDQFLASQSSDVSQKASRIGDPSKVVPQGAVIAAVLETAINSDLPGYTRAIVSRDVRSFDGTAVLIPRGSRLIGQYKSGLASGETRAFIIWNRLLRADGVSVSLDSPATDDLGQAGMSGSVDSHFVKRFGSAMLLSVVNGLAGGLNKSSTSNTVVIGTSSDAQGVIGEALSTDVKIPPTIKVPQGQPILVFAARDLDFNLGE